MAVLLFSASYGFAQEGGNHSQHKGSMKGSMTSKKSSRNAVEVGNKICPVSKEPVGSLGEPVQHAYKGKIYNFCCKMCVKSFKKNPEKYVRIVEEMMAEKHGEKGRSGHEGHGHGARNN